MTLARGAGRRYSGLDAGQRAVARRTAILAAALELFGAKGYAATSVKQICAEAELTERYFYESFKDRHACLVALYAEVVDTVRGATTGALESAGPSPRAMADAGLAAFVECLTEDARRARIVLIEVVGVSAELEEARLGVLREFAELVTAVWLPELRPDVSAEFASLTAVALVGAVNHLLVDWLLGGRRQRVETLVEVCATLFEAAQDRLSRS
ncbi:TetR/AcrR family transcriptional regulator [Rhodococcus spelaei]|uniref:TetR/AcrR family transcriptional regulator n=1 Tax=Rhodococcus spelaei TaxID=2546320 RepID=A0A541BP06_9NOCA|nr:TetR/AcrR family transcriptional regulator [Rhodococcus spelaei]TQF74010.1 TetR/AcrR family transcriptional regulator [Rhodococcus spelaei]